jgi:hypothetical protein
MSIKDREIKEIEALISTTILIISTTITYANKLVRVPADLTKAVAANRRKTKIIVFIDNLKQSSAWLLWWNEKIMKRKKKHSAENRLSNFRITTRLQFEEMRKHVVI